jgi:hypothetical protein
LIRQLLAVEEMQASPGGHWREILRVEPGGPHHMNRAQACRKNFENFKVGKIVNANPRSRTGAH